MALLEGEEGEAGTNTTLVTKWVRSATVLLAVERPLEAELRRQVRSSALPDWFLRSVEVESPCRFVVP